MIGEGTSRLDRPSTTIAGGAAIDTGRHLRQRLIPLLFAQVMTGEGTSRLDPPSTTRRSSGRHGTSLAAEICSRWKKAVHCFPIIGEVFHQPRRMKSFFG